MPVNIDLTRLRQMQNMTPQRAGAVVRKLALDSQAEIVDNFNTQSPSPPGEAPGVDTGALRNSIVATKTGPFAWLLRDGVEYGVHLEYGTATMTARPFFLPAIERMIANLPTDLAEAVYITGDIE